MTKLYWMKDCFRTKFHPIFFCFIQHDFYVGLVQGGFHPTSRRQWRESDICAVLTKTRNDLKRPEITWNNLQRSETTHNEQETTWNDLQRTRNDRKQPTTNKAQPTKVWIYQKRAKKDAKPPTSSRFWDYFTARDSRFSSLTRLPPKIYYNHSSIASWRITVKIQRQTFVYHHVYLLRDIKFTGYVANHFDARKFTLKNDWMLIILCLSNRIEKFSNLLKLKSDFKFT